MILSNEGFKQMRRVLSMLSLFLIVAALSFSVAFWQTGKAEGYIMAYPEWDMSSTNEVKWYSNNTDLNNALVSGAGTQVDNAVAQWDTGVTGSYLDLVKQGSHPGGVHFDIVPIDFDFLSSPPAAAGWADIDVDGSGFIELAVIWLDDDTGRWDWNTSGDMDIGGPGVDEVDVRAISVHEVGHTMGFEHKYWYEDDGCDDDDGMNEIGPESVMCAKKE